MEVRPAEVYRPEGLRGLLSPCVPRLNALVDHCKVFVIRHVPDSGCVVSNRYGRQWLLSIGNQHLVGEERDGGDDWWPGRYVLRMAPDEVYGSTSACLYI